MRILFITNLYPPEIAACAARVSELAACWAAAGHQVTVLTSYPNHPGGRVPSAYGRAYWWRVLRERDGNVNVVRAPLLPAANRGTVLRALKFASAAIAAAIVAPALPRPDIVIATSPPLLNALPGLLAAALRRVPLVFEVRDLWPEQMLGVGYSTHSPLVWALRRLAQTVYRRARHVVIVSPAYAPILHRDYAVPAEKMTVIPNGVDSSRFRPGAAPQHARFGLNASQYIVGFAGTMGLSRRFEPVLDAAGILQTKCPQIQFLILGDGARRESLAAAITARSLRNVHLFNLQPRSLMPGILATMDAALVVLDDHPYFRVALPSKMFEVMAMARPILLFAQGAAADLLRQAEAGLTLASGTDLARVLLNWRAHPEVPAALGRNGRRFAARYERAKLASDYMELLRRLLGQGAAPGAAASAVAE